MIKEERRNKDEMTSKENNKNAGNANATKEYQGAAKNFLGGNSQLLGQTYDVTGRDFIHQFAETTKAIADYVEQEYTHGGDIRFMIENLTDYNLSDQKIHQLERVHTMWSLGKNNQTSSGSVTESMQITK